MRRHKNETRPSSVRQAGDVINSVDVCRKLFDQYDLDGTGKLDLPELRNVIRKELRLPNKVHAEDQLTEMYIHMESDNDGQISADEFSAYVTFQISQTFFSCDGLYFFLC